MGRVRSLKIMSVLVLNYFFRPHNVWLDVVRLVRDVILEFGCSELVFREYVSLPFLSGRNDGGFSHYNALIDKMHYDLRIIFKSGNKNIICESFYYLITVLTQSDFTMGRALEFEKNPKQGGFIINFIGEEYLWTEVVILIDEMINYFTYIKTTYCTFTQNTNLFKCTNKIIESLFSKKVLIENIIINCEVDSDGNVKFTSGLVDNTLFNDLIFIPHMNLCHLFKNVYLEFICETSDQYPRKCDRFLSYNINFNGTKLITL